MLLCCHARTAAISRLELLLVRFTGRKRASLLLAQPRAGPTAKGHQAGSPREHSAHSAAQTCTGSCTAAPAP